MRQKYFIGRIFTMKSKKTKLITLVLSVLILASMLPMTTMAAEATGDEVYTLKYLGLPVYYVNIGTTYDAPLVRFELYDADDNLMYYAYCANANITCNHGDQYKIVQDKNAYFNDDDIVKIKAALTYIYNNYASMETDDFGGYQQLIQATVWRLIHGYEVTSVNYNINGSEIKTIIDEIYDNIDDLVADYNGVTIVFARGSGNELDITRSNDNLNCYGPFSVSDNKLLKNVIFELELTQNIPGAEFIDTDGNVISSVTPGDLFYVRTPYTRMGGDIQFIASAQAGTVYVEDFVLLCNTADVNSEGELIRLTGQPLVGQPLVSFGPKTNPYSAGYEFNIPGTPEKKPVYSPKYNSVTLTNFGYIAAFDPKNNKFLPKESDVNIVENSNHFTYAKLSVDDLKKEEGVKLSMVVGNKIDQIGTASVKMVDGKLEVTIDGVVDQSKFGAVAFQGFMPTVKNGNIHSLNFFSHNNKNVVDIFGPDAFSTDKKSANYDKDWADITKNVKGDDGFIYLYFHFDSIIFDLSE